MATKFLEPGGDADFLVGTTNGFWTSLTGSPVIATDFVNTGHIKSIKYPVNTTNFVRKTGILTNAGGRISSYFYFKVRPSANARFYSVKDSSGAVIFALKSTSAGVLFLVDVSGAQLGSNGATLTTATWHRISYTYTLTSTTVNEVRVYVNGVLSITVTNNTFSAIGADGFSIGNEQANVNLDFRSSDHYIDDSTALTDPGNIFVTAKRPNANGTTNGFSTQIGSGGSGYGTGHSPQVNERALSTTNGWSMVGAGSAVTEEYNIESISTGDVDITNATIVDWVGWVSVKSLVGETIQIILDGANNSQAITSTITLYTKVKGSTTYPSGTGTDIGITTDTSLTTVSLYECGILVAYIPNTLKTITGLGRIQISTPKTETGLANIVSAATTKTETGLARITVTTLRTITGLARITVTTLKTITGLARITITTSKTITGLSRITATTLKTIPGLSRITALATKTILGLSRVTAATLKTLTGLARITNATLKTVTGVSRIKISTTKTETGLARITAIANKPITGVAKIQSPSGSGARVYGFMIG